MNRNIEYIYEQFLDVLAQLAELEIKVKFIGDYEKNDYFSNAIWIRSTAYLESLKNGKYLETIFSLQLNPYGPEKRIIEIHKDGNRKILLLSSKNGDNWKEYQLETPLLEYLNMLQTI